MIVDGNVCNLKNRVIEVWAEESFTILTKRKIVSAFKELIIKDNRFNEKTYSFEPMVIKQLWR